VNAGPHHPANDAAHGGATVTEVTEMPDLLPTQGSPAKCSIEVFRRGPIPGTIDISYYVRELPTGDIPSPDPLDIIAWDQEYQVVVDVVLSSAVRRHFCARLCVDLDVDTCGPSPDLEFPERYVDIDPAANPSGVYQIVFPLPPNTFLPDPKYQQRCGRVYRLCITVGSTDKQGAPGLIWAHCAELDIMVHPPVPVP